MKKLPFYDIRQRAESGDAFSQVLLGFLLEHGLRMAPNKSAAEEQYRQASEQDFTPGKYALAMLIADSDAAEGIKWFREAAEAGYAPAQFVLGYIYQDGQLTEPNDELAIKWIEAAVDQGYVPAIAHLTNMYFEGISVEKNQKKAMKHLRNAAEKGDLSAVYELGERLVLEGQETDIEEGLNWIWAAAKKSHPYANEFLANMYGEGLYGASKDLRLRDFFLSRSSLKEDEFF